jgi:hypothetical protein
MVKSLLQGQKKRINPKDLKSEFERYNWKKRVEAFDLLVSQVFGCFNL